MQRPVESKRKKKNENKKFSLVIIGIEKKKSNRETAFLLFSH